MNYCTLQDFKSYKGLTTSTDDARINDLIAWSTQWINFFTLRHFDPIVKTVLHDVPIAYPVRFGSYNSFPAVSLSRLPLLDDLLSLTSVTNGDGNLISNSYVMSIPGNGYPKTDLQLRSNCPTTWTVDTNGNAEQAIAINGIWGYHTDYANAWLTPGATLSAGLTDSATSLTCTTGKLFAGDLIKIGSEYMLISSVTTGSPDTVTVVRASNGSTAAAHLKDDIIYTWYNQANLACIRLTAWRYAQKDSDVYDKTYDLQTGVKIIPTAVPEDIWGLLPPPLERLQ